jgi:hypothetical protein
MGKVFRRKRRHFIPSANAPNLINATSLLGLGEDGEGMKLVAEVDGISLVQGETCFLLRPLDGRGTASFLGGACTVWSLMTLGHSYHHTSCLNSLMEYREPNSELPVFHQEYLPNL